VSIPTLNAHDPEGEYDEVIKSFIIEMAPLEEMPHAVHLFLEQVAHRLWDNGWFYLNGPHVFQAGPQIPDDEEYEAAIEKGADERVLALKPFKDLQLDSLAFPEYSEKFTHLPWTLGYTGRPGGPDFYINKVDNSKAHGPGGQTHHELVEHADPCFAKIVDGMDTIALMVNAPTVHGDDANYRFFFEEPVQMLKVRMVQHPTKLMNLAKVAETIAASNIEGQQPAVKTEEQKHMEETAGRVEVEMGGVKHPEDVHHLDQHAEHQQHKDHQDYVHHNDAEHSEHHRTRHRKHPKLSDIRPEHTVEA
jgi:hypothetical protein